MDNDNKNFTGLTVTIPVSIDEAEILVTLLTDNEEDNLADHVEWCIRDAKEKYLFRHGSKKG